MGNLENFNNFNENIVKHNYLRNKFYEKFKNYPILDDFDCDEDAFYDCLEKSLKENKNLLQTDYRNLSSNHKYCYTIGGLKLKKPERF